MKEVAVNNVNGIYSCDTGINSQQWLEILCSTKLNDTQRDVLIMFYREPGHRACCSTLAKKYQMSATGINNYIWHLGKFAAASVGGITIKQGDNSKLWPIVMDGKELKDGHFEWTVKPEIAEAIKAYLLRDLVIKYRGSVLEEGLDNSVSHELYKWKLVKVCDGETKETILKNMVSPSLNPNLLSWQSGDNIKKSLEADRDKTIGCFGLLDDNSKPFSERFISFKKYTNEVVPAGQNNNMNNERTASLYLTCLNPKENTIFMPTLYDIYCNYIGEESRANGERYPHFLALLEDIIAEEKKDTELHDKLKELTSKYVWSDLLNAQDVLWQTKTFMKASCSNWLQKIYDNYLEEPNNAFLDGGWFSSYKKNVAYFQETIKNATTAEECNDEGFLYEYMVHRANGIADVGRGGQYRKNEFNTAYDCWPKIFPILKDSLEKGGVPQENFDAVWKIMYEEAPFERNHPNAIRRLWSGIFPNYLSTTVDITPFNRVYNAIRDVNGDLPAPTYNWLTDNIELINFFNKHITFKDPWHSSLFAWIMKYHLDKEETNDMDEFTSQLKESYNLVLTGAPGTGKTWLANAIAESMGASADAIEMVQFHPSYDYTDFVEGIRPTKEGGFKRVDGVFKDFCKKALKAGRKDGKDNFDDSWNKLTDILEEKDFIDIPYLSKSGCFRVELNEYGTGLASRTYENDEYDKGNWIQGQSKFFSKEQLYNIYQGKPGTQKRGHDNYRKAIVNYMKSNLGLLDYVEGKESDIIKPFVFIIDEINRGELSKIFGELFFSIDPGYRKKENRKLIKTQYQGLIDKGDDFADGFFVPENVYIIGTMNDIDRSVESMDFAIRRRFAWMEITPEMRKSMWDDRIEEWKEEAGKRMDSLNKAICSPENGLGPEFCIGPAYFLKLENYSDADNCFDKLWQLNLRGVIAEYLRGNRKKDEILKKFQNAYDLKANADE